MTESSATGPQGGSATLIEDAAPRWPTCQTRSTKCGGVWVGTYRRCLAHLTARELAAYLATLEPGSDVDFRGTTLSEKLLDAVLYAVTDDRPHFGKGLFDRGVFEGYAHFTGAWFEDEASFLRVKFSGDVIFQDAVFQDAARFAKATFAGRASFSGATFADTGYFARTTFEGGAWFDSIKAANGITFGEGVFGEDLCLTGATVGANLNLSGASVATQLDLDRCTFEQIRTVGPVVVGGTLKLDHAVFIKPVEIEAAARGVSCRETTFTESAVLRLRRASVTLDGLNASASVVVALRARPFEVATYETPLAEMDESALDASGARQGVGLLSLRGVDASQVKLINVDLSYCQFAEVRQLDKLGLEGRCPFARAPRGLAVGPFLIWRYYRRQMLAEEHILRSGLKSGSKILDRAHDKAWKETLHISSSGQRLTAEQIAVTYRQLRKAYEDVKNEPGAADFYYGEMEMRRSATDSTTGERWIVLLYWLISGYGLRARRAFISLMVLFVLGAAGFATIGLAPRQQLEFRPIDAQSAGQPATYQQVSVPGDRPGWGTAVDQTVDSTVAILKSGQSRSLTPAGRALHIALGFLGPLLLGMLALAIRNQVKR